MALARHATWERRRTARRAASQKEQQDKLTTLFRSLCPAEAEEMDAAGLQRSSCSESDPLDESGSSQARKQRPQDEGNDWCRELEHENRTLWKIQRQTLQVLTGYLKTRSSASMTRGPHCLQCSTPLSCQQCAAGTVLDLSAVLRGDDAVSAEAAIAMRAELAAGHHAELIGGDMAAAFADLLSPSSQPTVPEEEPMGEPDAGTMCFSG